MNNGIAITITSVLLLGLPAGCGGAGQGMVKMALERGDVSGAVEAYQRIGEAEPALLGRVAAALLEKEALGSDRDRQQAALEQLAGAGWCGCAVLQRLAGGAADDPGPAAIAGVEALRLLAARRDGDAVSRLREMIDAEQPEVRAAAVSVLRLPEDLGRLLAELESPYPAVRLAAARALSSANRGGPGAREGEDGRHQALLPPEARLALEKSARQDPATSVRSAALWSLADARSEAAESIEQALADPEREVRLAAIGALVLADAARAGLVLGRLLQSDLNEEGITAARHLLARYDDGGGTTLAGSAETASSADVTGGADTAVEARSYLKRALGAADPALRAVAAVSVDALEQEGFDRQWLLERIEKERVPRVRLSLVNAVWTGSERDEPLRGALREIGAAGGVSGAYAIARLAELGDRTAFNKLQSLLARGLAAVKRVAARALGRDLGRPHLVRRALGDEDASVRIAAAGAVLRRPFK